MLCSIVQAFVVHAYTYYGIDPPTVNNCRAAMFSTPANDIVPQMEKVICTALGTDCIPSKIHTL